MAYNSKGQLSSLKTLDFVAFKIADQIASHCKTGMEVDGGGTGVLPGMEARRACWRDDWPREDNRYTKSHDEQHLQLPVIDYGDIDRFLEE